MSEEVEDEENVNCLANKRCPKCKSWGPFWVRGHAWFRLHDDGCNDFEECSFSDDDDASCSECEHMASWGEFDYPPPERHEVPPAEAEVSREAKRIVLVLEKDGTVHRVGHFDPWVSVELRDYRKSTINGDRVKDVNGKTYTSKEL